MIITTEQNDTFHLKIHDNERGKIIAFHSPNSQKEMPGKLSYYFDTFLAIPEGHGLCVNGEPADYISINADTVSVIKEFIQKENV